VLTTILSTKTRLSANRLLVMVDASCQRLSCAKIRARPKFGIETARDGVFGDDVVAFHSLMLGVGG
jgi:hypothetical protein